MFVGSFICDLNVFHGGAIREVVNVGVIFASVGVCLGVYVIYFHVHIHKSARIAVLRCEYTALQEFNVCMRIIGDGFQFGQNSTCGYFVSVLRGISASEKSGCVANVGVEQNGSGP